VTDLREAFRGSTVLVTGANGFVAGFLIPRLAELGASVFGIGRSPTPAHCGHTYLRCDLLSAEQTAATVREVAPRYVFHLASQASVGTSWQDEWGTIETNVKASYGLFRSLEREPKPVRLLFVSSGEVYGDLGGRPARETDSPKPTNPYAMSKAIVEMIAHRFRSSGLDYVIARAFNHTGPGRPEKYFEASVAAQFARAAQAGRDRVPLTVGNIDNVRDYSDVRDVIEKYLHLAAIGTSGNAYNVCSGEGRRLRDIIGIFERLSGIKADLSIDRSRFRPNDLGYLVGVNGLHVSKHRLEDGLGELMNSFRTGRP
jgi:GDP-4-dehydro-6-deoxy-D-mannose reductase